MTICGSVTTHCVACETTLKFYVKDMHWSSLERSFVCEDCKKEERYIVIPKKLIIFDKNWNILLQG